MHTHTYIHRYCLYVYVCLQVYCTQYHGILCYLSLCLLYYDPACPTPPPTSAAPPAERRQAATNKEIQEIIHVSEVHK